jgi:hypothetical protein
MTDDAEEDWLPVADHNADLVHEMLTNNGITSQVIARRRMVPTVLVPKDNYDRALELIDRMNDAAANPPIGSWLCGCGEISEGQFDKCWNCQRDRSGS